MALQKYINPRRPRLPPELERSPRSKEEVDEAVAHFLNQLREERDMAGIHSQPMKFWRTPKDTDEEIGDWFNPFVVDEMGDVPKEDHWESGEMLKNKRFQRVGQPKKDAKSEKIDLIYQVVRELYRAQMVAKGVVNPNLNSMAMNDLKREIDAFVKRGGYVPDRYPEAAHDFCVQKFGYAVLPAKDAPTEFNAEYLQKSGDTNLALIYDFSLLVKRTYLPSTVLDSWKNLWQVKSTDEEERTKLLQAEIKKLGKADLVVALSDAVSYMQNIHTALVPFRQRITGTYARSCFDQDFVMLPFSQQLDFQSKNSALKARSALNEANLGIALANLTSAEDYAMEVDTERDQLSRVANFLHTDHIYYTEKLEKALGDHRRLFVTKPQPFSYPKGAVREFEFTSIESYYNDAHAEFTKFRTRTQYAPMRKLTKGDRKRLEEMRNKTHMGTIRVEREVWMPESAEIQAVAYQQIVTELSSARAREKAIYGYDGTHAGNLDAGRNLLSDIAGKHYDQIRKNVAGNLRRVTWERRAWDAAVSLDKEGKKFTGRANAFGAAIYAPIQWIMWFVAMLATAKSTTPEQSNQEAETPVIVETLSEVQATLKGLRIGAPVSMDERLRAMNEDLVESNSTKFSMLITSGDQVWQHRKELPSTLELYLADMGVKDYERYCEVLIGLTRQLSEGGFGAVNMFPDVELEQDYAGRLWGALAALGIDAEMLKHPDVEVPVVFDPFIGAGNSLNDMKRRAQQIFATEPPFAVDWVVVTGTIPALSRKSKTKKVAEVITTIGLSSIFWRYEMGVDVPLVEELVNSGDFIIDAKDRFLALGGETSAGDESQFVHAGISAPLQRVG